MRTGRHSLILVFLALAPSTLALAATGCVERDRQVNAHAAQLGPERKEETVPSESAVSCQDPSVVDGSEVCAQWAAVRAARDSVHIARLAKNWNIAGLVALLLTLFATAWAAFAARRAAVAAEKSIEEYRTAIRYELRAYLALDDVKLFFRKDPVTGIHPSTGTEGEFYVRWINSGQTPATDVIGIIDWIIRDKEVESGKDFPSHPDRKKLGTAAVGPQREFWDGSRTIDKGSLERVEQGKYGYVWAALEYLDIFGRRWRTEAALKMLVTKIGEEYECKLHAISFHNNMDEGCAHWPPTSTC